jgi:hypothetical protein
MNCKWRVELLESSKLAIDDDPSGKSEEEREREI